MPEQVLTILKLCLLALLYLFFLRVLRAVWSEVREPATPSSGGLRQRRKVTKAPAAVPRPVTTNGAAVVTGAVTGAATGAATAGSSGKRPSRVTRSGRAPRELVVVGPEHLAGASARLDAEVTIGRGRPATIVVDDSYVSQAHTRLTPRDGRVFVEDLGSTNGTYLNSRRVTAPAIVHRGDRLQVGNVMLEVR